MQEREREREREKERGVVVMMMVVGRDKDSDRETDVVENITTPWMPCPIDPLLPSAEGPTKHKSSMD